ncbi:hypothetical protein BZG36_02701 [Bifiguratus adelaidae]|uniref:Ubiquitin-like domain-containing protein n=1 Tax=Bifiguratus adelaidae TaxID=1938954 RepID=A0A261Y1S6_9FUNG|nr:hypothetical protein BZG36_02701 [Bifiguratus adelaidae]
MAEAIANPLEVHCRFGDGSDVTLTISLSWNIAQVKEKLKETKPSIRDNHLRLIYQGRVLLDHQVLNACQLVIGPDSPIYFHIAVADATSEASNSQPQLTPSTGFDRLREAGFSDEDIANLRRQFHRFHGTSGSESTEQTRRLEDQWMDNASETLPDGTPHGTYNELVWGLMLGFFLGLMTLFWFREHVFSRKHQLGIIFGLLINISFGVLYVYY